MRSPRTLLVIGADKIAQRALAQLAQPVDVLLAIDRSNSIGRLRRLIRRGSLSVPLLAKMALAELRRPTFDITAIPAVPIGSHAELVALCQEHGIERLILFRAGLIIRAGVIHTVADVLNVHSASLPAYGGIGTIQRALDDGAFEQAATLHRVTERIDEGEVLDTEPYRLSANNSYFANEELAYAAGAALLKRTLQAGPTR